MPIHHASNGNKAANINNKAGLVQWFGVDQYEAVENAVRDFEILGFSHIRILISWAEWHQPNGKKWYDWLFQTLGKQLKILPCIHQKPHSSGFGPEVSVPSLHPGSFTGFIDEIISAYGQYFDFIELWLEPDNLAEYDYTPDPGWKNFGEMIRSAAALCRQKGKKTVLGGLSPVDPAILDKMFRSNIMQDIDAVGIHGYPNVSAEKWDSWDRVLEKIRAVLEHYHSGAEIWITEAGYSTWQKNERLQLKEFITVLNSDADRIYWNGLKDQPATSGVQPDERKNYFGMKGADGSPKLLYTLLAQFGISALPSFAWMAAPVNGKQKENKKYTLITGGAGFVGINLADRLLSEGKQVLVFDNLSRAGVQNNLFWLKEKYGEQLLITIADIRDKAAVTEAVKGAGQVFHFAAQVAVTTSLVNPFHDFEVNAQGTLNLLEAIRNCDTPPPIIFTSTNKVYGELSDLGIVMNGTRYHPENLHFRHHGIGEERNLDFHSPYGCSKGVADQYIIDYGRTFGLKTVVFRMSCIYGPHQFGTEDQGWVAHFLIQALKHKPITLYGDGKQVRDILFVEDLVNAFLTAQEKMETISGQAFNIGGGVNNTVSLLELINLIGDLTGNQQNVSFNDWRPGDQKYYVSDYRKFAAATGWVPKVSTSEGVRRLYEWLSENAGLPDVKKTKQKKLSKHLLKTT